MSPSEKAKLALELLEAPTGNYKAPAVLVPGTRELQRDGDSLSVTIPERGMEEAAAGVLEIEGLDPREWEVTGFRRSEWGEGKVSTRYTYRRRKIPLSSATPLSDAELAILHRPESRTLNRSTGDSTLIVCIADCQVGKFENDTADMLSRVFGCIEKAARDAEANPDINQVVVAFLGDEIEGFVSQGGSNAWRTPMPLTEQIRITRRIMLHAMVTFHAVGLPLSMAAIPGNHDEAVRIGGKGTTTYTDSHDIEALLSVYDAAQLTDTYKDVKFYTPERDEIAVSLNLSGTHTVFAHGHMARSPNKLMEWARKQAFNRASVYTNFDLAVFGHFHSYYVEMDGPRMVVVCPTLEAESTWYRHTAGTGGNPGMLAMEVGQGRVYSQRVYSG